MILEPTHILAAFALGFIIGLGLFCTMFFRLGCKHEYEVIDNYKKHTLY